MKKTVLFCIAVLMFLAVSDVVFSEQAAENKDIHKKTVDIKSRVVRIEGFEGVNPLNLFIEPGTVVIWLNQYYGDVGVKFPDKKVTMACKSPVNFSVNKDGVYVSNPIGYGAVASLCFLERGTYKYFMERSNPSRRQTTSDHFRFEGKIVVK